MGVDRDKFLLELFEILGKSSDFIASKQLAIEYYETVYGVFDFTRTGTGLQSVAVHPSEEYYRNNILENRLRDFKALEINKHYGINFNEYMQLPRHRIETINRIIKESIKIENDIRNRIESEEETKLNIEKAKNKINVKVNQ